MDHQMLSQPPLPLIARRSTKRYLREFVVQFERHRNSCEREGRDIEAVSIYDLVDEVFMDTVCCSAFRGRSSTDDITERDVLEALREEAGMLDTAPSALEFKNATRDVTRMQPGLRVEKRIHEVKMGVVDVINKNGWRQAVRQRFNIVPRYGRLVVEALLEGIWPEDFRERVVTEARFREISGDPDLLYDLMEEMLPIQTVREEERRILRHRRMWSDGSGFYHDGGNGGHGADGTGGVSGGFNHGRGWGSDRGSNPSEAPGSGYGGSWLWRGSGGGGACGGLNHGGGRGGNRGSNHKGNPGNGNVGNWSWRSQGGGGHGDGGSSHGNGGNGHGGGPIVGGSGTRDVGGSGTRDGGGHGDGGSGQDNDGGSHGGAGVLAGQRPSMVPPVPGTGQLHAPAVVDSSAEGGPNGSAVATRTRSRNGTGPAGQHEVLLDAGTERVGGQGDSYAPTSSGARAEAPREQDKVGSVGVSPGPDPRVVRSELPEAPAREGAGGTQGAGDDVQGGADMPHGSAPGYTTSARVRAVEPEGPGLARVKTNAAHESMAAQRYPVPNNVPARLRVKGDWG